MGLGFAGNSGSYAELANAYSGILAGARGTIAFWMKPTAYNYGFPLATKNAGAGGVFAELNNVSGGMYLGINGTYPLVASSALQPNVWTHVAIINSAVGWWRIVNNVIVASSTAGTFAAGGTSLWLGRWDNTPDYPYSGKLADIRVWNRGLNPYEIYLAYSGVDVTDGLAARWKLDQLSGSTFDSTIGTFPGTITGTAVWDSDMPTYGTFPGASAALTGFRNRGVRIA